MRKAKFNYFGHLSVGGQVGLLIIFCVVLAFSIHFWKPIEMQEKVSFLWVTFSFISIIFWLVHNIVTHLKRLEYKAELLMLTNLFTKRVQKIPLEELAGYQWNGLTLKNEMIDLQGKTVATIYAPFYQELNAFFLEAEIQQLTSNERYFRGLMFVSRERNIR